MRSSCRSICRELPEGLQPRDLRDFRLALPRQRLEDDDFGLVGFGAGRRGFRRADEAVVGSRHDLCGDALRGVAYAGHAGRRPAEQFAIGRFEGPLSGIAAAQKRGVKFGRPKRKLPKEYAKYYKLWKHKKISAQEGADRCNMTLRAFYCYGDRI